jgi:hypothetical protein
MAAPATTTDALRRLCPALYALDTDAYGFWVDLADASLTISGWGTLRPTAVALLAAHQWARLTGGSIGGLTPSAAAASGVVTSESAGNETGKSLSRSYAASPTKNVDEWELSSTVWGQQFLAIRKTRATFGLRIVSV